jgi:hypothetical protein
MDMHRALKEPRLMKALTGLAPAEFSRLLVTFAPLLTEAAHRSARQRDPGGGRKGGLKQDPARKLFFILLYVKTYPTFDMAGFLYEVHRSRPHKWTKQLLPLLREALGREIAFPERQIRSVEEFFRKFPEAKDLFIDGTERPRQRPQKGKAQKKHYAGKKKRHTRKNIVWADEHRRILLLSPTKHGRLHDKKASDKNGGLHAIPPDVHIWTDTGFLGHQRDHPHMHMPKKGSKHHPLTEAEKEENRIISSFRIVVEHAIGGMKRFKAAADICRSRNGWDDELMSVCAGLWNFHLRCA